MARLTSIPVSRQRPIALAVLLVVALTALAGGASAPVRGAVRDDVRILAHEPESLDPAAQGDIASAALTAQLFESLTAFDPSLTLRPALAASWDVSDDGRRIVFHLRPRLTFSDGSPLTADDVVASWLRLIDPAAPSPLSSLLLDVSGAADFLAGKSHDPGSVGMRADGSDVTVTLVRPGSDFPAIVSASSFGVVPAPTRRTGHVEPGTFVGSGAYVLSAVTQHEITLTSNPRYWAGPPSIRTAHMLLDIGGRSPVAAFESNEVDYADISPYDAPWIAYDARLGPELRSVPSLALTYLGFDTSRPPFDDVRVRRAFGSAVDWKRVVKLAAIGGDLPATSMVPPGVAGRSEKDWLPAYDPATARSLLADAGYPGGTGFPEVEFAMAGTPYGEAIADSLHRELGVTIRLEEIVDHFARLHTDPTPMWTLGWVADYPGPNDFLGVLLGTGSSNDYGRWSSGAFDAAIDRALSTRDPARALAGWEAALGEVQRDVPVVPLDHGSGWALSRDGLLGAGENGLEILRLAGLAWKG